MSFLFDSSDEAPLQLNWRNVDGMVPTPTRRAHQMASSTSTSSSHHHHGWAMPPTSSSSVSPATRTMTTTRTTDDEHVRMHRGGEIQFKDDLPQSSPRYLQRDEGRTSSSPPPSFLTEIERAHPRHHTTDAGTGLILEGLVVFMVLPGSSAELCGYLEPRDIIVAIDNRIAEPEHAHRQLSTGVEGTWVKVQFVKDKTGQQCETWLKRSAPRVQGGEPGATATALKIKSPILNTTPSSNGVAGSPLLQSSSRVLSMADLTGSSSTATAPVTTTTSARDASSSSSSSSLLLHSPRVRISSSPPRVISTSAPPPQHQQQSQSLLPRSTSPSRSWLSLAPTTTTTTTSSIVSNIRSRSPSPPRSQLPPRAHPSASDSSSSWHTSTVGMETLDDAARTGRAVIVVQPSSRSSSPPLPRSSTTTTSTPSSSLPVVSSSSQHSSNNHISITTHHSSATPLGHEAEVLLDEADASTRQLQSALDSARRKFEALQTLAQRASASASGTPAGQSTPRAAQADTLLAPPPKTQVSLFRKELGEWEAAALKQQLAQLELSQHKMQIENAQLREQVSQLQRNMKGDLDSVKTDSQRQVMAANQRTEELELACKTWEKEVMRMQQALEDTQAVKVATEAELAVFKAGAAQSSKLFEATSEVKLQIMGELVQLCVAGKISVGELERLHAKLSANDLDGVRRAARAAAGLDQTSLALELHSLRRELTDRDNTKSSSRPSPTIIATPTRQHETTTSNGTHHPVNGGDVFASARAHLPREMV